MSHRHRRRRQRQRATLHVRLRFLLAPCDKLLGQSCASILLETKPFVDVWRESPESPPRHNEPAILLRGYLG